MMKRLWILLFFVEVLTVAALGNLRAQEASSPIALSITDYEALLLEAGTNYDKVDAALVNSENPMVVADYVLFLHAFGDDSPKIKALIQAKLDKVMPKLSLSDYEREAFEGEKQTYDGSTASLRMYYIMLSTSEGATDSVFYSIPCVFIEKRPDLMRLTDVYWGGNRDNFMPRSGCSDNWPRVRRSGKVVYPSDDIQAFVDYSECCNGNFINERMRPDGVYGTIVYTHLAMIANTVEEMRVNPQKYIESAQTATYRALPFEIWSYMGLENRDKYFRLMGYYQKAYTALSDYYIAAYLLGAADAQLAAKEGLNTVAFGARCGDGAMRPTLRKLIMDDAPLQDIQAYIERQTYLETDIHQAYLKCSLHAGMNSILHVAVDRLDVLEYLLQVRTQIPAIYQQDMRYDINLSVDAPNSFGKTPLMTAAHRNQLASVKILLSAGADVDAKTHGYQSWQRCPSHFNRTPLIYAAANGDVKLIKLLLDSAADKMQQDNCGLTAYDYLLGNGPSGKNMQLSHSHFEQAEYLLKVK